MRRLWIVLLLLLLALQWRLWVGEGSIAQWSGLNQKIQTQQEHNAELAARNKRLEAEVDDLKKGLDATEELARSELGMIKEGETFYQLVPSEQAQERMGDK